MVRAFICVEINNSDIIQKIENTNNELRILGIRSVKSEQLHLTLKFLGDTSEHQLKGIKEILSEIEFSSFNCILKGLGCFPNLNYIKVIWIGITGGKVQLIDLAKILEEKMAILGFPREKRSYSPHLTLARVKTLKKEDREKVKRLILKNSEENFGSQSIDRVLLKKSTLTPKGPIYEDLHVKGLSR